MPLRTCYDPHNLHYMSPALPLLLTIIDSIALGKGTLRIQVMLASLAQYLAQLCPQTIGLTPLLAIYKRPYLDSEDQRETTKNEQEKKFIRSESISSIRIMIRKICSNCQSHKKVFDVSQFFMSFLPRLASRNFFYSEIQSVVFVLYKIRSRVRAKKSRCKKINFHMEII